MQHILSGDLRLRAGRVLRHISRRDDLFERLALMRSIALDGLHQIRNQVAAALKLGLDVAGLSFHRLLAGHQPVIGRNPPTDNSNHQNHNRAKDAQKNPRAFFHIVHLLFQICIDIRREFTP